MFEAAEVVVVVVVVGVAEADDKMVVSRYLRRLGFKMG